MAYDSDRHKQLDYKWRSFADTVSSRSEEVETLTYDGITILDSKKLYSVDVSDRFWLPGGSHWLETSDLFKPLPTPRMPDNPTPPALQLPTSEYASWYIKSEGQSQSPLERDLKRRQENLEKAEGLRQRIAQKRNSFQRTFESETLRLAELRPQYEAGRPEALVTVLELSNRRHWLPLLFRQEFKAYADPSARIVLMELSFPDLSRRHFQTGKLKNGKSKYASDTEAKRIVRRSLYSIVIRAGYIASRVLNGTTFEIIVVNVNQGWFDPATGAPKTGIICSLQARVLELLSLNTTELNPEECFKHLKGIAVPSLEAPSPMRPIFVLNKSDERFIESKNLDAFMETESNLAAMPWEDFEHLVAQLFEWEFAKNGVEVRVTRTSRDRGVDAILFDPDPLRGGKFVLQAKRYTKPVDVAAVRDLYGTVMNEGANRGILITTSSYGPDAYEFAKNKPISLVDGPNLLVMLRRHGKSFRIDLVEARRLMEKRDL
jgi:restriction system protein